jgi:hypothetical protein
MLVISIKMNIVNNKKKPTTNDDGLGQAQNCGRVKPVQYRYHY